ncbi:MAG: DNA-3-methyladenine glycosylase 2 family protein [bacterium]|nr:DNA-3-methyladenine glycosylase 2 family protein [bacterium]
MANSVIFTDPVLHDLYQQVVTTLGEPPEFVVAPPDRYFAELAETIIGQQLSTKVADTITQRVRATVGEEFSPGAVLATEDLKLRQAGLSNAKVAYIKNVARAWQDGHITSHSLTTLPEKEVLTKLVAIKGVGPWTAEMFMMFTLGRPDVFSVGDLALKKAIMKAYDLPATTKPAEFISLSEQWRPNRTLACRILWKSLELPSI